MMQYARRVSPFVIDLQIIQEMLQVKTRPPAACVCFFRISLGFKQLARGLHVISHRLGLAAALLAAIAIVRIS
jgi:hypothetical protein